MAKKGELFLLISVSLHKSKACNTMFFVFDIIVEGIERDPAAARWRVKVGKPT